MKRYSPAVARNSAAIAEILAKELPDSGNVLEIASGSGEHAVFFARRFPHLTWQPSDPDSEALSSIAAWRDEAECLNLKAPVTLDAQADDWPVRTASAIMCINMLHISPWSATKGLMRGAERLLQDVNAPLIIYGPFIEREITMASSNEDFDRSLKSRNSQWGLRDLADVDALAITHGLARTSRYEMPANNLTIVYRKAR